MQVQRKTFRLGRRLAKQGPRPQSSNQGRVEKSATGLTMMKKTRILYLSQGDEQLQSRLMDHLTSNSLLNSHQPAYCKHHSTETALLYIHDLLVSAIKSQKISCLCLLDLSAAFDTIDHDILMTRLSSWFGIHGSVLSWFKSYLYIPGGPKKRPNFRMALCNRVGEMNQQKSMYVMSKHLPICL